MDEPLHTHPDGARQGLQPEPQAMQPEDVDAVTSAPGIEFCLVALSLSAVTGLTHLFTSGSYLGASFTSVVGAHLLAMATRRLRLSVPVTMLAGTVGLVASISWLVLPSTTLLGLPTVTTLTQAGDELSRAWQTFQLVVAPAPMLPGFVLAVVVAGWLIAFVADVAAFRANAPIEAAAPAAALFAFGAVLGQSTNVGAHRLTTALFLVSLGGYWLAQQALPRRGAASDQAPTASSGNASFGNASPGNVSPGNVSPGNASSGAPHRPVLHAASSRSLLLTGGCMGALSIAVAIILGPSLPGMDSKAIIPWRDGDRSDPGSRVTVSPLVDIRTRIVDQSNLEVFSVRSEARSYWRLTSLERFDGQIWSSEGRYDKASGDLPVAMRPTKPTSNQTVTQTFTIGELSSIWLPAAFQPIAVKGTSVRYDPTSSSLLTEKATANGQTYEVTSTLTSLNPNDLKTAPPATPSTITTTYLKLPDNFSPRLRAEAKRIVSPGATAYDQARLLQDYFRSGFTYDLDVPTGHTGNVLENFVFETRRGYCEQFAGVYAAMARSVGLPARVAVGFTPGEQAADGRLVVRGANGHAWPEVYLAGYGWVAFEPTPGRGIPNAEAYTGVPDQQAAPNQPTTATTLAPTATTTSLPIGQDSTATTNSVPNPAGGEPGNSPPWWSRLPAVLGIVGSLLGLWIAGIAGLGHRRRRRRRAHAIDAADQVLVAWDETGEALARIGAKRRPSETPMEYAQRVVASAVVETTGLMDLAMLATAAGYRPPAEREDMSVDVDRARATGAQIRRQVTAGLSTIDRARVLVDPRALPASEGSSYTNDADANDSDMNGGFGGRRQAPRSSRYSSRLNRS
ncbi:MAG: DUF3488 and transglutaminase-like domain-containing protein [Acidimicrobiales bacterium]